MKNKTFVKRLAMALIAIFLLSSLTSFNSLPEAEANSISENDQVINSLQMGSFWVTSYGPTRVDLVWLPFGKDIGYHTVLSDYIGEIVDTSVKSYLINWRPMLLGDTLQVCGVRVAFSPPLVGGGFDPFYSYVHIPGSVLLPRASNVEWSSDNSGGCIFAESGNKSTIFNINLNIPDGSRIDYLRVYYYREAQLFLPMINK